MSKPEPEPAARRVYCLRCGKAYASNDGVRKHAKRNHPNWIAEMDARGAYVFATSAPLDAMSAEVGSNFVLTAPIAPASVPPDYATASVVAQSGRAHGGMAFCHPQAVVPGFAQGVPQPITAASAAVREVYRRAVAQAQQQQQQSTADAHAQYAAGTPIQPPIVGVSVGEPSSAPVSACGGWPSPLAANAVGWHPAFRAHNEARGAACASHHAMHGSCLASASPVPGLPMASATPSPGLRGEAEWQAGAGGALRADVQQQQPVACVGGRWLPLAAAPSHTPNVPHALLPPTAQQHAAHAAATAHAHAAAAHAAAAARSAAAAGRAHAVPIPLGPAAVGHPFACRAQACAAAAAAASCASQPALARGFADGADRARGGAQQLLPAAFVGAPAAAPAAPLPNGLGPAVKRQVKAEGEREPQRRSGPEPRGAPRAQALLPISGAPSSSLDELDGSGGDIPVSMSVQSDGLSAYAALASPWEGAEAGAPVPMTDSLTQLIGVPPGAALGCGHSGSRSESGGGACAQGTREARSAAAAQLNGKPCEPPSEEARRAAEAGDELIAGIALTLSEEQFFHSALTTTLVNDAMT